MLPTLMSPTFAYMNGPQDILILGVVALVLLPSIFWIVELVDVARRQFSDPNLKIVWLLILIFSHGIGTIVYYFVGKKQGYLPGEGGGNRF